MRLAPALITIAMCLPAAAQQQFRRLPVREYQDKMVAGWVGQMVGVTWGLPVEFRFNDEKVPECMVPKWDPMQINDALTNDDVFNDSRLLYLIDKFGLDITPRQADIERWLVWGPRTGSSLRYGVAFPDTYRRSGYVSKLQGLGFQISADVLGLIAPGLPNTTISLSERLTDPYGDSLYGGQFVAAMYGEAFFETSMAKIIQSALRAIPSGSSYAGMVRDVLKWHAENPRDWDRTWQLIHDKYTLPAERESRGEQLNMDVLRNGGYMLLGLLYGGADPDRTIVAAMRGGDDADCNAANAAGVLFTSLGYSALPERFKYRIDHDTLVSYQYGRQRGVLTYPQILEKTAKLARAAVLKAGGRVEREEFFIPVEEPKPSRLYKAGDPVPLTNSRLAPEELAIIRGTTPAAALEFKKRAPGWTLGGACELGFLPYVNYRKNIFITYPPDRSTPCVLTREYTVPADASTYLKMSVSHPGDGAFTLIAKVDGREVFHMNITQGAASAVAARYEPPWTAGIADLTPWAGKKVRLELLSQPGRWDNPVAYWERVALESTSATGWPPQPGLWGNSGEGFRQIHEQSPRPREQ